MAGPDQVLVWAVALGALVWLWIELEKDRKKRKEEYRPMIVTPYTGTYSDIRGMSKLDLCVGKCQEWLDLPPFEDKTKYCIKQCIADFGYDGTGAAY